MEDENPQSKRFWDGVWDEEWDRDFWKRVAPEIVELIQSQNPSRRPEVLDLGCGLGRNAVAFAQAGFSVTATDLSTSAIAHLREWATQLDLPMRTLVCDFTRVVFPPDSFDIAISVNVLYHSYQEQLARAIDSVRSWLKKGGIFYFTCPTREDGEYGRGIERAPHTFEMEPGHMHYCADEGDLDRWLIGFDLLSRKRRDHHWEEEGVARFSSRWQVLAEKS